MFHNMYKYASKKEISITEEKCMKSFRFDHANYLVLNSFILLNPSVKEKIQFNLQRRH